MNKKGLFITFEGGEGAGKSTVLKAVAERLETNGYRVVTTREPGGVKLAENIRHSLLDDPSLDIDPKTEALLFAAARRQHLVEKIIPALTEGAVVLCDRFVDSSLAYQGAGRGIGVEAVRHINEFAVEKYMPDVTLLFDLPIQLGLDRIKGNKRESNHLDEEGALFHETVRRAYHQLASQNEERYRMIKADAPIGAVIEETYSVIQSALDRV
ncbi:dTMP kinase [Geomicrobium sp. JCM 19039]|uniref:dTMP kinase n=1 Tax=Geomicrobium sp. JCM 19039 TaxID=1460636 RepID=UPI00045F3D1E|nr:dTMP kinase [Geomicrobium sp. JCM 19039]GAK13869.1 thymidylate kinase [Geomicrobium sp. JCM 19039]